MFGPMERMTDDDYNHIIMITIILLRNTHGVYTACDNPQA